MRILKMRAGCIQWHSRMTEVYFPLDRPMDPSEYGDTSTGVEIAVLKGHFGEVMSLAFSHDDKILRLGEQTTS